MSDCIFCKIIAGDIPCSKIYEDDDTIVFLSIAPISKGHALVVPKEHYATLLDAPEEVVTKVAAVVKKVSAALMKATGCDGFNIGQNNFEAAGQEVHHLHVHVIPRFEGDGLKHWPGGKYEEGEMEKYSEKISKAL